MKRFQSVDEYIKGHASWSEELDVMRNLLLTTELEETVKWGAPIYTIGEKM